LLAIIERRLLIKGEHTCARCASQIGQMSAERGSSSG
jgi:hypothetical protein